MLNAELKVLTGKQEGNIIPLVSGRFLIGREEDCHLRPGNDLISRHHCVFKSDEYTVRVRDLGSTNGTFVNGERLRGEVMLNSGDKVKVGTLEFEVSISEATAATAEAEPVVGETIPPNEEPDTSQTVVGMPILSDDSHDVALQETGSFQGDTVYQPPPQQPAPVQQPGYPPGAYPQQPVGYQMPYPQQPYPPQYGQPYGMPMGGYPQQQPPYPPMYPQQPMTQQPAPQQPMPQQPAPQQPVQPVAEPAQAETSEPAVDVVLPDPSTTGAKPPEPKPPSSGDGKGASSEGAVRDTAMDIIKQYTNRRPQGS